MAVDLVRRSPHDVDLAAVGLPAGNAGSEVLVGVGNAAVVLFLKCVFGRIGIGIAPLPERLDKLLPFLVGGQMQEGVALFGRDDVDHVFVQPLLVWGFQLLLELVVAPLLGFGGSCEIGTSDLAAGLVLARL